MKLFAIPLTTLAIILTAPFSLAQSKESSINCLQAYSDSAYQNEPVIIFGQDTSRGRYLGKIAPQGRTTITRQTSGKGLPLRPLPEIFIQDSPISQLTIQALISFADAKGFWRLPSSSAGSALDSKGFFLPNNKDFITINLPCRKHTVSFKVGKGPSQFIELHSLLKDLLRHGFTPKTIPTTPNEDFMKTSSVL